MKVINLRTNKLIANELILAYSFFRRLKGLMFSKELDSGSGIHLKPCRSVHTFFMSFAIDVVYLNEANQVVGVDRNLRPGKLGKQYKGVRSIVELPAGTTSQSTTNVGDQLKII